MKEIASQERGNQLHDKNCCRPNKKIDIFIFFLNKN